MEDERPKYEINVTGLVRKVTPQGPLYLMTHSGDGYWGLPNGFMQIFDDFEDPIRRGYHINLSLNPTFFYSENEYRPLFGIHQMYFYMHGQYISGRPRASEESVSTRFMGLGKIINLAADDKILQPFLKALEKAFGFNAQMLKYQG